MSGSSRYSEIRASLPGLLALAAAGPGIPDSDDPQLLLVTRYVGPLLVGKGSSGGADLLVSMAMANLAYWKGFEAGRREQWTG